MSEGVLRNGHFLAKVVKKTVKVTISRTMKGELLKQLRADRTGDCCIITMLLSIETEV